MKFHTPLLSNPLVLSLISSESINGRIAATPLPSLVNYVFDATQLQSISNTFLILSKAQSKSFLVITNGGAKRITFS